MREDALRARFRIQGYDSTQIEEEGARLHLLLARNDYATLHSLKIDTIRDDCTGKSDTSIFRFIVFPV